MDQEAQATSPAEPTALPSLEERSAAIFGDSPSESADEPSATPAEPPAVSTADPASDPAAERRARLEALTKRERERDAERAKGREFDEWKKKAEDAEKRAAEAERIAAQRIDIDSLDEEKFFAVANRAKVSPQRLGEFLRERIANPEMAAAEAAKRVVDPELATVKKQLAEQQERIDGFLNHMQRQRAEAEEREAFAELSAYTNENAHAAPYASALLRRNQDYFLNLAKSAAARLPEGAGWQAVLDQVEEDLSSLAPVYASPPTPQQRQAPSTHQAEAKAPTTVSNTLAQQRASVVDEQADWSSLPFEERSARLFR